MSLSYHKICLKRVTLSQGAPAKGGAFLFSAECDARAPSHCFELKFEKRKKLGG